MEYERIVVALAGKENEDVVIRHAIELTRQLGTKLSVLHVQHPGVQKPHMKMDAPDAASEEDLRQLVRDAGHVPEADSLEVNIVKGDPYHESIAEATRGADLMIVGHSQRNAFVAALMNSVDERVANVADCPVVIVPK